MSQIPFDFPEFRSDHLEEFVARFLSSGVSLTIDGPNGLEERRVLRAYRPDKTGGVRENGVDVIAKVEGGETWGFECKLYLRGQTAKWYKSDSEAVLTAAENHPADRFFLVAISRDVQRDAIEVIEQKENWEFWDADTLSSQFLTQINSGIGTGILTEFFNREIASDCYGIPRDQVLILAEDFYRSSSKGDSSFNHLTKLIGRENLLNAINQFVDESPKKVLLISAKGGEGKSRTLVEFANQFSDRFPKKILKFINPFAYQGENEESLEFLKKQGFVAVHEDAHRIETIRRSVLASIALDGDSNSKIIITTRPQGISAIRSILSECGINVDDIEIAPRVLPLNSKEMVELSKEVLGHESPIEAQELANLAERSPLICVVGGNLIRMKKVMPSQWVDSDAFKFEVFSRFEEQNLETVISGDPQKNDRFRRLLRALAVLAPYPSDKFQRQPLNEFLGISALDLEDDLTQLEAAEIISKTDQGWRVGPDLFADHLVYSASIKDGDSTAFCDELIGRFGLNHFPNLLRNLSEAEWRARASGDSTTNITDDLWQKFVSKFQSASFWGRSKMLETWSSFSYFLPERSIELANLAIELDAAPDDDSLFQFKHNDVLEKIAGLLQPIGIYNSEKRFEVFDILASLGLKFDEDSGVHVSDENHPWVAISKASSFNINQPLDSISRVVEWLNFRWNSELMAKLVDRNRVFLSIVLEPVFRRVICRTQWTDLATVSFETIPLSVDKTESIRKLVLDFIEKKVIPRSEVATLNVMPVLKRASTLDRFGSETLSLEDWRNDRIHAIELLGLCVEMWDSEFVRFSAWQSLTNRICYESDEEIVATVKNILSRIKQDMPLLVAFSTLGDGSDILLVDIVDQSKYTKHWDRWKEFHRETAQRLLNEFETIDQLVRFLQEFENRSLDVGLFPNWNPLITNLVNECDEFSKRVLNDILSDKPSLFDRSFGSILYALKRPENDLFDQRVAQAIGSSKRDLREAGLNALRWEKEPLGEKTQKAIERQLSRHASDEFDVVINLIGEALAHGGEWPMDLLEKLPIDKLNEEVFREFLGRLVSGLNYGQLSLDTVFLERLLTRMELVDSLFDSEYQSFLQFLSKTDPLRSYCFIRDRIREFERISVNDELHSFYPTIYGGFVIPNLNRLPQYDTIVEELSHEIRRSSSSSVGFWIELFQAAILRPDTKTGIRVLNDWFADSSDSLTINSIALILNVHGTAIVFHEEELVRKLLESSRQIGQESEVKHRLLPRTRGRGYTDGVLNREYTWVLNEALKAVSKNAGDPVLKSFYNFVVRAEERDRDLILEEFQDQMLL